VRLASNIRQKKKPIEGNNARRFSGQALLPGTEGERPAFLGGKAVARERGEKKRRRKGKQFLSGPRFLEAAGRRAGSIEGLEEKETGSLLGRHLN